LYLFSHSYLLNNQWYQLQVHVHVSVDIGSKHDKYKQKVYQIVFRM